MSTDLPSLIQSPAQPGIEDEFAGEGNVLVNQLTDIARSLRAAAVRELLHRGTVLELQADTTVNTGMDDDGRQNGYVLNSLHPLTGETLTHTNGRALLVRFPNANSARARFRITGDDGDWPLLGNWPQTQLPADGVITAKPYLIIFATGKGWFVIGREAVLSQALILAALEDGGFPGAKLVDESVGTDQIADDAITNDKLANDSVGTDKIKASAITRGKIGAGIITGNKIADATITADKLAPGAIPSPAWTAAVITATGDTTITAKEVEIEIWGAGGGGGGGSSGNLSGLGRIGTESSLVYMTETFPVVGGRGGLTGESDLGTRAGTAFLALVVFPTIAGVVSFEVQGAGAGGGIGGFGRSFGGSGTGGGGSYVRILINKTTAESMTLSFTIGAGGAGGTDTSGSGGNGAAGAPARALLRYR